MSLGLQRSEVMNPYFSITSQVFESIFHKLTLVIAIYGPLVKMVVTTKSAYRIDQAQRFSSPSPLKEDWNKQWKSKIYERLDLQW